MGHLTAIGPDANTAADLAMAARGALARSGSVQPRPK